MRKWGIPGLIALLAILGYVGYATVQQNGLRAEAQKELRAQEPEMRECEARLRQFYQAVQGYQKDHRGALPPKVEALYPRYVKEGKLFFCPTAERAQGRRATISQGQIEVNGRKFPVTYGFRWLTGGYARGLKKMGDAVPFIICDAHREALYQAVYRRPVPQDAFAEEKRNGLIPEVRDAKMLVIRKNGTVDRIAADQDL
ncbi:MAG: hypothetical protein RMJ43_12565 [Chloroherpetonaceae bacterium]|nr:hypothetical protein [Chthonomonadaceae bacterium]MDW8208662.1 hypothetical protein [Chloroherpetonaceae bacterium]